MDDKNKSAVEQFLEGTENEQSNPFEQVIQNPFEAPIEPKKEKVEETEEKPVPFHKDPKVQKFIERELEKRLRTIEPAPRQETQTEDEFKEVVDSFATIIGNDTPEKQNALKALERSLKSFDERAVRHAEDRLAQIKREEEEADRQAEEELDNAFEAIEENFDVDLSSSRSQKLRSEFVSFVEKIAPKDRNGEILDYPDMISAWETFSEIKKATSQPSRAKELANRSISRSSETVSAQPKRISWNDVDEFMDTLK